MGFRNRCRIAGAQGVVGLSIPLVKGRGQRTLVRDVRISDRQPWAAQHWKTIVSCYSRSPWFDHYRDDLATLYGRRFDYLLDWDLACFDWSVRALGVSIQVGLTERWVRDYPLTEAEDWRGRLGAKGRAEGDAGDAGYGRGRGQAEVGSGYGQGRGQEEVVSGDGRGRGRAEVGTERPVRYRQVFEERTGFIPNLSILDLLFCEGKNATACLRG